ncbi:hypothetical protein C0584_05030 [Candidatus Parcubacteria bacterium]|nr:MAG: hypothetical protein C0584_05030 [Candidatus Parcubacteria bacterium]
MLQFSEDKFFEVLKGGLDRFSENVSITASIFSMRELLVAGKNEFMVGGGRCQLLCRSSLGFRIIAANILAEMMKEVVKDRVKESSGRRSLLIQRVEAKHIMEDEPSIKDWCKLFNITPELGTDILNMYYSNNAPDKGSEE